MNDQKLSHLQTISPLDGRYRNRVEGLAPYFSQHALDKERVKVEIEYLLKLGKLEEFPIDPDPEALREIYLEFDLEDSVIVEKIEKEGYREVAATNHDVKAIEYFIRESLKDKNMAELVPYVHFALTSEDVSNLAYMSLIKGGTEVLSNQLKELIQKLFDLAQSYKDLPMLARTHGQPASPTTVGKEFAVFLSRLVGEMEKLKDNKDNLSGKLAGASGNLNAHSDSYSKVDWIGFSHEFVDDFGLKPNDTVTQIEPRDNLATLLQNFQRINNILVDLARDCWTYISRNYFSQRTDFGEVGSSTMPQKVNPIDFENGEGNLSKSISDLNFLANYLTTSRLQRDLSDSTVRRNLGVPFAHSTIGYGSLLKGLNKIEPNEQALREDLTDHPEILSEAWQTTLRKFGHSDAYEIVKEQIRGKRIDSEETKKIVNNLPLPENEKARLRELKPETYIGNASKITENALKKANNWLEDN